MLASADRDGCFCLHKRNCAEIEGWQVFLGILNQLKTREKYQKSIMTDNMSVT